MEDIKIKNGIKKYLIGMTMMITKEEGKKGGIKKDPAMVPRMMMKIT
jgi:hypothetical protein